MLPAMTQISYTVLISETRNGLKFTDKNGNSADPLYVDLGDAITLKLKDPTQYKHHLVMVFHGNRYLGDKVLYLSDEHGLVQFYANPGKHSKRPKTPSLEDPYAYTVVLLKESAKRKRKSNYDSVPLDNVEAIAQDPVIIIKQTAIA
jgi:hypothetical protein